MRRWPAKDGVKLYRKGSESSLSKRMAPERFARGLASYDVISFDVFDTLLFRPFGHPADLFYLLGERLGYPDFRRIRMEMEGKARQRKYKSAGHYEVSLEEIYEVLSEETGIEKTEAAEMELQLEKEYCFANPYMQRVTEELRRMGKPLIVITDMYLSGKQIRELLNTCGLGGFAAYYSSSDCGLSKAEGTIYGMVRQKEGEDKSYVHIGDNEISDIRNAAKQGFGHKYYRNVNTTGNPYRTKDMSAITGSIYRGLVNSHIHNGLRVYSRAYEYGFIYGGLFAAGYCQFIHRYVKAAGIEKILFLARDGNILKKVYGILYPGELHNCIYVYWSRLAAAKMSAKYFKYDFFRRFLFHKANQGRSLREIFESMELPGLLFPCCQALGIPEDTVFTMHHARDVKQFLMKNWKCVLHTYQCQVSAGKRYFQPILGECKKAAAVDIGWAGSGAVFLDCLVNREWGFDCPVTGIIAGTNSAHNAEPDYSETFLKSGKLVSYLYSQEKNRDLWKFHHPGRNHNLYWEILLSSPEGSLKGFYPGQDGGTECRFKKPAADEGQIRKIQKGILDFVYLYKKFQEKSGMFADISGRDAYAPLLLAEQFVNRGFMKEMEKNMDEVTI